MADRRRSSAAISVPGVLAFCLAAISANEGAAGEPATLRAQTFWSPAPTQVPVSEGYVEVGGARLWYWDTGGDGEPVVLVHPNSGSALIWEHQQPVLARAGYRVVAYSRRGHSGSDAGRADEPGNGVDDLYRLIEHLELEKVHLVGVGAGADILPEFAVAHPERLRTLAIGCTIGKPGDPAYSASNATLLPEAFLALPAWLKELSPAYRAGNPQGTRRWRKLEAISRVERVPLRSESRVTPERIADIDVPTLLFTGDADLYMPPARLRAYASYWRNPELAIFSEAGHAPYWEQPLAFNALLLDFFSRHSETPSVTKPDAGLRAESGDRAFGQRNVDIRVLPAQTEWQPVPEQAPVSEGYVDADGVRLWYWDTGGDGVPVILLHPYTGSAVIWGYQQPELVAAGFRVIAYSRRGHYGSDAGPPDDTPPSADDLQAVVNHLRLVKFHLVGSGAGGFIASDYAVSHPGKLLSMTIACSTGGVRDDEYRGTFLRIRTPEIVGLPQWIKELGPSYRAANPAGTGAWINLERKSVHEPLRPPFRNALQWDDYRGLDLPVLLIGADADVYMPPPMLRELAARLPRAEVVMLSESGHSGYWEQPEAFNEALTGFLARQGGGK